MAAALKSKYTGIGKGKKVEATETQTCRQHFEKCLLEAHPLRLHHLLITSTADWLAAYEHRVRLAIQLASDLDRKAPIKSDKASKPNIAESATSAQNLGAGHPVKRARRSFDAHAPRYVSTLASMDHQRHGTKRGVVQAVENQAVSTIDQATSPMQQTDSTTLNGSSAPQRGLQTMQKSALQPDFQSSAGKASKQHQTGSATVDNSSQETPPSPVSLSNSPAPPAGQPHPATFSQPVDLDVSASPAWTVPSVFVQSLSGLPSLATAGSLAHDSLYSAARAGFAGTSHASSAAALNGFSVCLKAEVPWRARQTPTGPPYLDSQDGLTTAAMPSPQKRLIEAAVVEAQRKLKGTQNAEARPIFEGLAYPPPPSRASSIPYDKRLRRRSSSGVSFTDIDRISPEKAKRGKKAKQLMGIEAFLAQDAAQ